MSSVGIGYYSTLLVFPLAAAIISYFSFGTPLWKSIKNSYYLFAGYMIAYAAVFLVILSTSRFILPFIWNYIIFAAGYYVIFFIRAYLYTAQHDILAALPGSKPKPQK